MGFNSMKISTQLTLGFGLMALLIAVTGGLGIYNADQAVTMLRSVTVQNVKDEVAITKIRSLMETNRSQVLQLLQHNPSTEYSKWHDHPTTIHYKIINDTTAELKQIWARYEASIKTPEEKQMAADWYLKSGKLGVDYVTQATSSVKADQWDAGQSALIKGINPTYREGDAALKALNEYFVKRTELDAISVNKSLASTSTMLIIILVVSVLLALLIGFVLVRTLYRQLGGELVYTKEVISGISRGNLSQPIVLATNDQSSVLHDMHTMQISLSKVVSQIRQGTEAITNASGEIAQGNNDLSARTESQASALEETAASMEQLNATVKQNADSAKQANQLALSASTVAVKGGEVVAKVVDTMKGINDSSRKISDIISVIDGIAFQTNILALNAAVEAARAGEQGRGFAVVASEVRSLAGRSAEAAKEIKNLIGASVERVEQGTALVDQAGVTMTEVVNSIKRVTDLMGEISAASSEQSEGVAQVGEAIMQMDQVTQQNAALVEEMAAAASSLKGQAQDLVGTVALFKLA